MKKNLNSLLFMVLFTLVCCFSACQKRCYYSFDELYEGLKGCEIVYIEDDSFSSIKNQEVMVILELEDTANFIGALSELEFTLLMPVSYPWGYCVKLIYEDHYWMIGRGTGYTYNFDDKTIMETTEGVLDSVSFMALLSEYAEISQ